MAIKRKNDQPKKQPQKTEQPQTASNEKVRIVYEHRSIGWSILAFVLAFILGIIATLGTLVGVGFWALNSVAVKDILSLLPEDYRNVVREDKSSKTVLELVSDITSTSWDSFAAIDAYTPVLRDVLTSLTAEGGQLAELGITLNVDEFMNLKFSEAGQYLSNNVMGKIQVGKLLQIHGGDSVIMRAVCYGKEGENGDYTIVNGDIVMNPGKTPRTIDDLINDPNLLNNMEIGELLEVQPTSDALTIALCYGEEGTNYRIENGAFVDIDSTDTFPVTVKKLSTDMTEIIEGISVEAALGINVDSTPLLRHLAFGTEGTCYEIVGAEIEMLPVLDEEGNPTAELHKKRTIGDLTDAEMSMFEDMKVGDIAGIEKDDPDATVLLKTISDWTLKELTEDDTKVKSLKVNELISIDPNASPFVNAVAEWKLSDLESSYRIERLKISQVVEIDDSSSILLQAMSDWRIGDLSNQDKINSIFINELLEIDDTSPLILQAIANSTLGDLPEKVNSLTLAEMIDENELKDNKVLKNLKHYRVKDLSSRINELTIKDVFEHEVFSYTAKAHYDATINNSTDPSPIKYYVLWSNDVSGETVDNIEPYFVKSDVDDTELLQGYFYLAENGKYMRVESDAPTYELRTPIARLYEYLKVDYEAEALVPLTAEELALLDERQADAYGNEYLLIDGVKIELQKVDLDEYEYADGTPVTFPLAENERVLYQNDGYCLVTEMQTVVRYFDPDADAELNGYAESALAETAITRYRTLRDIPAEQLKKGESYVASDVEQGTELEGFLNGIWWIMLGQDETLLNEPVVDLADILAESGSNVDNVRLVELWLHGLIAEKPHENLANFTISDLIYFANDYADYAS